MPDAALDKATSLDAADPLGPLRDRFFVPRTVDGDEQIYFVGHSLGLQPRRVRDHVVAELDKWADLGVRGHFTSDRPWAPYHEFLAAPMASLVGARPEEVVVMNGLTVNLHLMLVSFYRPTPQRHKLLIEAHAFPSDHFAVESQIRMHGYDPASSLVTVAPAAGEKLLPADEIIAAIQSAGPELALVMLPGVQYYTGQVLPMAEIVAAARKVGAFVGFDLAHAAGNVELSLHDWGPDFAVWCTYKYLNAGPGATAAAFVHRRHHSDAAIPRLHGWWGHDKATRFEMKNEFEPIPTAEAWQLSNAPVLSMAPLAASLEVFDVAGGMGPLRRKSELMSAYFDELLDQRLAGRIEPITPRSASERGCQLSLRVTAPGVDGTSVFAALQAADVECDWRHPDVIRVAPVPLYNQFVEIYRFVQLLDGIVR